MGCRSLLRLAIWLGSDRCVGLSRGRCDAVGEGLFTAVALEMDPGNRIFTTLPVVPVPERMSQE